MNPPLLVALNEPGHLLIGVATGDNLGYRVIFAGAAIWFLLGTLFVTRIRGVR